MKVNFGKRLFSLKQNQYFPNLPQSHKIKRFYKKVDVVEHPLTEKVERLAPNTPVSY